MGLLDSVTGFLGGGSESSSDPSKVASFQQPFLQDIFSRAQDLSNVEAGQTFAHTTNMFNNTPALTNPNATEQTAILAGSNYINGNACP